MSKNMLVLNGLTKTYGDFYAAKNVSLELKEGEFLTLLGPSGSGKTTTLKMVAGLEIPTSGQILVNGQDITFAQPDKRGLGMVFQNYALFPHMTILENIMFPLKMKGNMSKPEMEKLALEYLQLVQLEHTKDRKPNQLSGGQQQRIALARALVFSPPIVLMDEPLGALDKKLRVSMQLEIKRIQQKLNITTIYVTHDQEEALTMSDRIAIMKDGEIAQLDAPKDIYEKPNSAFIADFIGESNFIPVDIVENKNSVMKLKMKTAEGTILDHVDTLNADTTKELQLVIRPEKMSIGRSLGSEKRLTGKITDIIYLGNGVKYVVLLDHQVSVKILQQVTDKSEIYRVGEELEIGWSNEAAKLLA